MIRLSITVKNRADARDGINQVQRALAKSNLSIEKRAYLDQAICSILELWETQIDLPSTKDFLGQRSFSGDDYNITIRAAKYPEGFIGVILRLLRLK